MSWEKEFLVENIKGMQYPVARRLYTAIVRMVENGAEIENYTQADICQAISAVDLSKHRDILRRTKLSLGDLVRRKPEIKEVVSKLKASPRGDNNFYVPAELLKEVTFEREEVNDVLTLENDVKIETPNIPDLDVEMEVVTQQEIDLGLVNIKPELNIDTVIDYLKSLKQIESGRTIEAVGSRIERLKMDIDLIQSEYNACKELLRKKDLLQTAITTKTIIKGEL